MTTIDHDKLGLQFPCDINIKVIGKNDTDFEKTVIPIVRKYCPNLKENAFADKQSKNNNYLAMTITATIKNREDLEALYTELKQSDKVIMAL